MEQILKQNLTNFKGLKQWINGKNEIKGMIPTKEFQHTCSFKKMNWKDPLAICKPLWE